MFFFRSLGRSQKILTEAVTLDGIRPLPLESTDIDPKTQSLERRE